MNNLNNFAAAHRRKYSGELDVFETTRNFSGGTDGPTMAAEKKKMKSSEMEIQNIPPSHNPTAVPKVTKEKKCKQSSSPGARLASFLNSIFHQKASKKKSKSSPTRSLKEYKERFVGRKERSSDSRSLYSFGSSGLRTPRMIQKEDFSSSYPHSKRNDVAFCPQTEAIDAPWLPERPGFNGGFFQDSRVFFSNGIVGVDHVLYSDGFVGKRWVLNKTSGGFLNKDGTWVGEFSFKGRKSFKVAEDDDDDDGATDCSSDLFELKSYDLTGLHVCGSTPVF